MSDSTPNSDDALTNLQDWMNHLDSRKEPRGTWLPDEDIRDRVWRLEQKNEILVKHLARLIVKVEELERAAGDASA